MTIYIYTMMMMMIMWDILKIRLSLQQDLECETSLSVLDHLIHLFLLLRCVFVVRKCSQYPHASDYK